MLKKVKHIKTEKTELRGMDSLGAGYDIFGDYATTKSIKRQLFDWNKYPNKQKIFKNHEIPDCVIAVEINESSFKKISGISISKYREKLSLSLELEGMYKFFSGSLESNFDLEQIQNARNEYISIKNQFSYWALKLELDKIKPYMKEDFKHDVETLHPKLLFSKYGTHFLSGIIIGGEATYDSSVNILEYHSKLNVSTTAELSYKSITHQLSAKQKTEFEKEISEFNKTSQSQITTQGGRAKEGGQNIINEDGFKTWSSNLDTNLTFFDFIEPDKYYKPLMPIWSLCEDQKRKDRLITEYSIYMKEMDKKYPTLLPNVISNLRIKLYSSGNIYPNDGYRRVEGDLNESVGGKFIYIEYLLQTVDNIKTIDEEVITDLKIIIGVDTKPPKGFEKIGVDLNTGAGGEFIYLCYKKTKYSNTTYENTIKDLLIISGDSSEILPPQGFEKIGVDLNAGAGGKFIFLCYSKNI